jgi:long-chain fatty acid transport protein
MARYGLAALALLACVAWTPPLDASPQEVVGFGYRSIAMGTTGAAAAEGVDAVYGNPALLSQSHDLTLELGIMGASPWLSAEGAGVGALPSYPALSASTIGGLVPLPFGGVLEDRVTIGLGFVTPFDLVVRARILYPERAQFLMADRLQSVAVQAAVGLDIGYGVRLGGGFMALAALTGSVVVATDATGRIGTTVQDTLVASYAPLMGAAYDINDEVRIGVSARGELVGRFNVVISAENLGALRIPPLNISGIAQYDPWQVAAEVSYAPRPWAFALGLTYKHWLAYPGPVEATVRCEDSGDPELACGAFQPPEAGYSPIVAPRLGVERLLPLATFADLSLRAGYAFEPSPAPEQEGRSNYFDNHKSVFALGFGVDFDDSAAPIAFDGFLQLSWLHDRSHEKQTALGAAADGVVDTGGGMIAMGTSASVRF